MAKRKRKNRTARLKKGEGFVMVDNGPTPQTKARLRPDPVLKLFEHGFIGDQERRAYEEILLVRKLTHEGMDAPAMDYAKEIRVRTGMSMAEICANAILQHSKWMKEAMKSDIRNRTQMRSVVEFIIKGHSFAEIDAGMNKRKGTAKEWLILALTLYAEEAGWIARETPLRTGTN